LKKKKHQKGFENNVEITGTVIALLSIVNLDMFSALFSHRNM